MSQRTAALPTAQSLSPGVRATRSHHSAIASRAAGGGARAGALIGGVYSALSWPDLSWWVLVPIGCGLIVGTALGMLSCLALPASRTGRQDDTAAEAEQVVLAADREGRMFAWPTST